LLPPARWHCSPGAHFRHGTEELSSGDVAIDSLSATRTGLLRVQNDSPDTVRVYTVMKGMTPNYVAKANPGAVRTWVLDPKLFPNPAISFELRPVGKDRRTLGPYKMTKGQVVDIVIPSDAAMSRGTVHQSVP